MLWELEVGSWKSIRLSPATVFRSISFSCRDHVPKLVARERAGLDIFVFVLVRFFVFGTGRSQASRLEERHLLVAVAGSRKVRSHSLEL